MKQTEEWKGDDRTTSEAFMRSFTFSKTKNLNFLSNNAFPWISRVYHGRSWRLSNCHIQRLKKMNLFKILNFQKIHFFRKRPWKCATPFVQPNCENKSFGPDHQILNQCPIRRFLTMITNFLGSLSQKEDDFLGIINWVWNYFGFRHWESLVLKIKGIFE